MELGGTQNQLVGLGASWEGHEASWEGLGASWEGLGASWESLGGLVFRLFSHLFSPFIVVASDSERM